MAPNSLTSVKKAKSKAMNVSRIHPSSSHSKGDDDSNNVSLDLAKLEESWREGSQHQDDDVSEPFHATHEEDETTKKLGKKEKAAILWRELLAQFAATEFGELAKNRLAKKLGSN